VSVRRSLLDAASANEDRRRGIHGPYRIGIVSLSERYTSPRRCIDTVSPMEAKANGRALEEFIKRRIETGAQVHSLLELSRETGIRPNTMYDWFTGRRSPRTDSLARIAAVLRVSTSNLLDAYEGQEAAELNAAAVVLIETAVTRAVETGVARGVAEAIRDLVAEGLILGARGRG